MKIKNPLRMWFIVPFAVVFTIYTFYYQIILNQIPPIFRFSPSINNAVQVWASQSGFDVAGQFLVVEFIMIGLLVLYLEWTNHD